MDETVLWMIAAGAAVLVILVIGISLWLWLEHRKLKQEIRTLSAQVQRSSDDLVGLCSAAIAVDKRLEANEFRVDGLLENIVQMQEAEPERILLDEPDEPDDGHAQSYESAIEKIHLGAGVEDLVRACGLTRDEAVLLVRLHGKR